MTVWDFVLKIHNVCFVLGVVMFYINKTKDIFPELAVDAFLFVGMIGCLLMFASTMIDTAMWVWHLFK